MSCHPSDGIVDNDYPEFDDLKTFYDCQGYPSSGYNATGVVILLQPITMLQLILPLPPICKLRLVLVLQKALKVIIW